MARGVNKVILVGNLGGDPDVRYTGNGTAVTTISIATSEQWTDKQSGERQERTEWHRVKLFGKLAEIAGEYLKKGRQVYVEGSLRHDKYTDREGIERYTTDVIASEMQMIGGSPTERPADRYGESRFGGGERGSGRTGKGRAQRDFDGTNGNGYQPRADGTQSAPPGSDQGEQFTDDDLPF